MYNNNNNVCVFIKMQAAAGDIFQKMCMMIA